MEEIAFTKVKLPYGWLGNMSPHPIRYEYLDYSTAEALFQVLRFKDSAIRAAIRSARSPMTAKMVAKAHADKMVVIPRSAEDLENMRLVLTMKLAQHADLEEELLKTGDAILIEDCSARSSTSGLFWGMARSAEGWKGENQLGKLWMERRAALREG